MISWLNLHPEDGILQRTFIVDRDGVEVPGVLWTPERSNRPLPLVLVGHGGAGHKMDDSRIALGHRYARSYDCAVLAIDGPWHGDRSLPPGSKRPAVSFEVVADMVADWKAALDALIALPEIDEGRVGYGGVSMGTMFGLPLIASEPRIKAAVLGLCGLIAPSGEPTYLSERLAVDAPQVHCPTMFLVQWDDELFPRDGAFALFGLLGATDKRLFANPGGHSETPDHVKDVAIEFLASHLS